MEWENQYYAYVKILQENHHRKKYGTGDKYRELADLLMQWWAVAKEKGIVD